MDSWSIRIKERMNELGMTQDELASHLGLTRSAITHYLAGRREPPLKQFQKLATVLKTNPAWLLYGVTEGTSANQSSRATTQGGSLTADSLIFPTQENIMETTAEPPTKNVTVAAPITPKPTAPTQQIKKTEPPSTITIENIPIIEMPTANPVPVTPAAPVASVTPVAPPIAPTTPAASVTPAAPAAPAKPAISTTITAPITKTEPAPITPTVVAKEPEKPVQKTIVLPAQGQKIDITPSLITKTEQKPVTPAPRIDITKEALEKTLQAANTITIQKPTIPTEEKKLASQYAIPILSWEQAKEFIDPNKVKLREMKNVIPHFYSDNPNWYALSIQNDAMTAPHGNQSSFHQRDVIIVDPNKTPMHGNYVIALLPNAAEVIFKQYVIDGGIRYLKPLNPQYPTVQMDEKTRILGVVITCLNSLT